MAKNTVIEFTGDDDLVDIIKAGLKAKGYKIDKDAKIRLEKNSINVINGITIVRKK